MAIGEKGLTFYIMVVLVLTGAFEERKNADFLLIAGASAPAAGVDIANTAGNNLQLRFFTNESLAMMIIFCCKFSNVMLEINITNTCGNNHQIS